MKKLSLTIVMLILLSWMSGAAFAQEDADKEENAPEITKDQGDKEMVRKKKVETPSLRFIDLTKGEDEDEDEQYEKQVAEARKTRTSAKKSEKEEEEALRKEIDENWDKIEELEKNDKDKKEGEDKKEDKKEDDEEDDEDEEE